MESNNFDNLKFKFGVEAVNIPTTEGTYKIETNKSAKLYYLSTSGIASGSTQFTKFQMMPSPELKFEIRSVVINYLDEQGEKLSASVSKTGEIDTPYTLEILIIDGYELNKIEGNQEGKFEEEKFEEETLVVNYIYQKNKPIEQKSQLKIQYLDEQNNELALPKLQTGNVGETYQTKALTISGCELIMIDGNEEGVFQTEDTIISYIYRKIEEPTISAKITVNYVDKNRNIIAKSIIINGEIGDKYTTQKKRIAGYKFVTVEGQASGIYSKKTDTITYVYNKLSLPQTGVGNNIIIISIASVLTGMLLKFIKKD